MINVTVLIKFCIEVTSNKQYTTSTLLQVSLTSSSSLSPLRSSRYSSGVVKRTASDGHRYSGRLSTSDSTKSTTLTSTTSSTTSRVSRSTSSGFGRTTETRQQRAVKVSQMSQVQF